MEETSRSQYFELKPHVPLRKEKQASQGGVEFTEDDAMLEQFTSAMGE